MYFFFIFEIISLLIIPITINKEWAKSIPEEAWLPIVINDVKSNNNT